jgi:hypothetical protein
MPRPFPPIQAKDNTGLRLSGIPGMGIYQANTGSGVSVDRIRYTPIFVSEPIRLSSWAAFVTTGPVAVGTFYFAIYECGVDLQPGKLVYQSSQPLTTASNVFVRESNLNIPLSSESGMYLVAINSTQACSMTAFSTIAFNTNPAGGATPLLNRYDKVLPAAPFTDPGVAWDVPSYGLEGIRHQVVFSWDIL